MATDTTNFPQGDLNTGTDMGADLDLGGTQLAQASGGEPVHLDVGAQVILVPVQPGQFLTLPADSTDALLAKIGPEGNLSIVVDGRTIIFQGYVAANDQAPVKLVTSDGVTVDVADVVAATDPSLDIQTAAGPAAGAQGDTGGGGIYTPFVPGEGPGLIGAEGVLGATALAYKLIDDERVIYTTEEGVPSEAQVSTFAAINPAGEAFMKEDVETPIALIAIPGAGDTVTQLVLDNIPAGWTVNQAGITLTEGTLGAVTLVGDKLTIAIVGAGAGVPVSAYVPVTAAGDSDIDGSDLVVEATAVDGAATATASSTFNAVVDAVLDQYLDVSQSAAASATESAANQLVDLNLTASLAGASGSPFAHSFAGGAGADNDGSEVLPTSATISLPNTAIDLVLGAGAPAGVTLVETAPDSGQWVLNANSPADLQAALGFVQASVPAGFDGAIDGSVTVTTSEANTPEGTAPASGNEPDTSDNAISDTANFSVKVTPDTSVETDAVIGNEGAGFLKEDVFGPVTLTAYPGATDHVTQIVLSNIPAGWDVKDDSLADFVVTGGTIVGTPVYDAVAHTITFDIAGAADGAAVSVTVQVKAAADSDVDGSGLTVAATAVDGDGGESATSSSNFNVPVDAVLDQFVDVSQSKAASAHEQSVTQYVGLNLTSVIAGGSGNPFANSFAGGAGADTDGSEVRPMIAQISVLNTAIDLRLAGGFPAGTTLTETAPNSGVWVLSATSATSLRTALGFVQAVVPAGFDGTVLGSISVTTQEANTPSGSAPASGVESDLGDNAVTDTTSFTLNVSNSNCNSIGGKVSFAEDTVFNQYDHTLPQTSVAGQISFASVVDLGVGEALTALTITGIPAGATLTLNGVALVNGVALTPVQLAAWISGTPIVVIPAANRDNDFSLNFSGQTTDTSSGAVSAIGGSVGVRIDAAADDPTNVTIDALSSSGDEQFLPNETGTVKVTATFGDVSDGTESHSLVVTAPAGFLITSVADLNGLTAANISGLGTGTVTVTLPGGDTGVDNLVFNVKAPATYSGPTPAFTVTASALDTPTDLGSGGGGIDNPANNLASEAASDSVTFKSVTKPTAEDVTAKVDEDGIPVTGNNDSKPGDDNANVSPDTTPSEATWREDLPVTWNGDIGTITLAAGDWSALRSSAGNAIVAIGTGTGLLQGYDATDVVGGVPKLGATPIFEVQIVDAATGVYEVRLLKPIQHPDSNNNPADNATDNGTGSYEDNVTIPVNVTYANVAGSTTKSLSIDVDDDSPTIAVSATGGTPTQDVSGATYMVVDEDNIAGGLNDAKSGDNAGLANGVATGTLTSGVGADQPGSFSLDTVSGVLKDAGGVNNVLTATGHTIALSQAGNVITGKDSVTNDTVFTLTLNANGTFTFDLDKALKHSVAGTEDDLLLSFGAKATDRDGDAASTAIRILVDDDMPSVSPLTKSATVSGQVNTNLMLVLDVSGSMADPSGLTDVNKLQLAVASIKELLEQYDARGDVKVQIVTFSSDADIQPSGVWLTVSQAKAFLGTLSADGYTNYDAALADAISSYGNSGKIAGAQNIAYFLSDGNPNRPSGDAGVDSAEETTWTQFLKDNDINAYALGFGEPGDVDPANLHPVAYNGAQEVNTDATVVTDPSQLTAALVATVTTNVSGNLKTDGGNSAGADGGYIKQFTYNGANFNFDGTTITRTGNALAFTQAAGVLTFTVDGFKLVVNMNTGAYTYTVLDDAALPNNNSFGYTLSDTDGDTASSTLGVTVTGGDIPPIVRDDAVYTNISGSGATILVPDYALLWNDTDANGNQIGVSGVHDLSSLSSVTHAAGNVSIVDNNSNGGSFTYDASANGLSDSGLVTVDRGQAGESTLDGNGLDNILVGRSQNDTLNGYEGNDVLIGGDGKDTLNGGEGNDLLVGGGGNDTINLSSASGDHDTVLITSVLDGNDRVTNFGDGVNNGGADSQDRINLDGLFDSLGVATADREARVQVSDGGSDAIVTVDLTGNGFGAGDLQLTLVGIGNPSNISVGLDELDDIQVGKS